MKTDLGNGGFRNFEIIPLRNFHCLSAPKSCFKTKIFYRAKPNEVVRRKERANFGNFRKYFKILAEFPVLNFWFFCFKTKEH